MEQDNPLKDWLKVIDSDLLLKYRKMLFQATLNGIQFEPDGGRVFHCFRSCPYEKLNTIILGQDPYPQKGVATGLAFANDIFKEGFTELSPSLRIISNSLIDLARKKGKEYPIIDASLKSWANQGILLLNSALTVKRNMPGSHTAAWKPFIEQLIHNLSKEKPFCWVLLGKQAWEFKDCIENQCSNVFMEYHPSYYARNNKPMSCEIWEKMLSYTHNTFGIDLKLYG